MRQKCETLLVRHMPNSLTDDEKTDLLKFFGAENVRCMRAVGKLRHAAFATFPTREAADNALSRLHQAELLGSRLVVEYASQKQADRYFPAKSDQFPQQNVDTDPKRQQTTSEDDFKSKMEEFSLKLHSLSSELGLDYVMNPMLNYAYPPPSPSTIANIATVLISVPKFYHQVLHLMNKMNLPAPFGPLLPQPPMMQHVYAMHQSLEPQSAVAPAKSEDESSEMESEMESDDPTPTGQQATLLPQKRKKKPTIRRPKLQKLLPAQPAQADAPKAAEVFEPILDTSAGLKPILFNLKLQPKDPEPVAPMAGDTHPVESAVVVQEGGFGLIASQPKLPEPKESGLQEENPYDWAGTHFMDRREIREGRISSEEMKKASVFRNYDTGEPASRLYIKNVAKAVDVRDLFSIYGSYVDAASEQDRNAFDIQLMKEGRMKGQAFLTFANERQAERALRDTNGFLLKGKPLVVHFARSAKAKAPPVAS